MGTGATVAVVPARGGSRGVIGKNLRTVGGRTLVARAVDSAVDVPGIDRVVISSDDDRILAEGAAAGAEPWRRPNALAADDTPMRAVIDHIIDRLVGVETLVLLQPTSPLRTPGDVAQVLAALVPARSATTVTPVEHHPSWMFVPQDDGTLEPLLGWGSLAARRQDGIAYTRLTGAVYAASIEYLRAGNELVGPETVGVVVPAHRSVDVDGEIDLMLAELLLARSGGRM